MIKPVQWLWTGVLLLVLGGSAHAQGLIAVDDEYSVPFGAQLVVEAPGVLDNDTFDGEPAEDAGATAVLVDDVFYGFLSLASDGSFTYTPDSTFPGIDSFTYEAVVGGDTSQATVILTACSAGPGATQTVCWKEAPYLAKLGDLGYRSFQEGFENDAAWGSVRSPSTALLVVSQGIEWQTNHPDPPASNGITTGSGPARTGLWGVYDPAHGYATGTPAECDVDVPPPQCLYHDGFTGTRQSGESTLYGVGGHFMGSLGPNLVMILNGGTPIGLGLVPTGDPTFFGVIDTAGFTSFRVQETDGKIGQTRLVFGDDFIIGTTPADVTPPQVSLVNSVADTGDGVLAEGEVTAAPITKLLVTFDELVSELGGETAPHSVTNLENYLLFSDGGDGFDTVDCATGVDAGDNAVAVDWVSYTSGSERKAILDINGGGALGTGNYRLLVCGTTSIKDWAGNILDGDGNGTGGDDFARNFTVAGTPGTLQFSLAAYPVAENGTSATITVTRTGGSFGAASVDYATADGSATAGSDYTAASGTLNWIDGDATSKTFVVPIIDDTTYEGDETVNLLLTNATGATLGSPSAAVLTITENDPVPPSGSVQFSVAAYSVAENGTSATITVTRTGGSFGAASVDYGTADGSATAGSDYTTASGTLNWIDGDATSKTFVVAIIDDTTYEGDETVNLSLANATGATLGSPSAAVLTITENDPVPPSGSLQFSSPTYSVAENGTSVLITVTRTGGSFGAASVDYATADGSATAGSDYTAASGTLNWIDGDATSKTFVVPIIDDTTYEGDETVTLSLENATGATLGSPSAAVLTITENDPVPPSGSLQYSSPTYSVAENGTSVLITVTRTGGSFGAASVDYATADGSATAGSDYTAASGTLNWIDGDATSKTFVVAIIDDTTYEGDETVNLSLTNVSGAILGAPSSAVLTITENDPVPPSGSLQYSSPTYSVAENGTSVIITVTRTGGSFGAASVDYATADGSATAGSDYTATSGTLNWIDGDGTSKTFVVAIIDDTTYEGDETVNLSLTNATGATLGAPSSAVLTIIENDPAGATTWYVSPTGSDTADCITPLTPCRTIGEAVFRSISGDSIQVASGVYPEVLILSKSLTVIGDGASPVLDGTGADVVVTVAGGTTVSIKTVEIRNGTVGGVENLGNLDLFECWIHSNGNGTGSTFGGVANTGSVRIERSTVSGNFGDASGGIDNSGQLEVVNSTIQGNQAAFAPGILNSTGANLDIRYSTVAENGTYGLRGAGTVNMEATIIALHGTTNCESVVNTLGHNLEDRDSCGFDAPSGDIIYADPLLEPLGSMGGPTPTMALQAGSPAIDSGVAVGCEATDQRGIVRPVDGDGDDLAVCDIGAFELQPDVIFKDGFDSGDLSGWGSAVGGP